MGLARGGSVFVGHTSELADYPPGRSFVQATLDAVAHAGLIAVDMRHFAAREDQPASYCRQRVRECDAFLAVVGFRYGSTIADAPLSYTEMEFDEAVACGLPRLVFMLDGYTATLPPTLVDPNRGAIETFRHRLRTDAAAVVKTFSTADELAEHVYQALVELSADPVGPASLTAAAKVATTVGTTVATTIGTVALEAARQDPRPVLSTVDVTRFTGRTWVVDQIDAFIHSHECGYIWVEGPAGTGKTALAAHLVDTRGYLSHFVRPGETSTPAALRNLASQLIQVSGLKDLSPGGMLPDWTAQPGGLAQLLGAAADRRPTSQGPLVLLIDGLDEVEKHHAAERPHEAERHQAAERSGSPLGLPWQLPPGVFVVGTYRTATPPITTRCPSRVVAVDARDPRNLDDLTRFLEAAAIDETIVARLAEQTVPANEFVRLLADRCGGVWVYARYVLGEIRLGTRRVDQLERLPASLWEYYTDTLVAWQARPDWACAGRAVLVTLAAVGEPVTARTLGRLAGVNDPDAVHRWCDVLLAPFLAISNDTPPRYSVYHASLRELLRGELPPGGQPEQLAAMSWRLARLSRDADHRIADRYLQDFGGLDASLAALADDPELANVDSGYPLRHLVSHLIRAHRWGELKELLTSSYPRGPTDVNVWFATHDHHDTVDVFLYDLHRARRHAERATHAAVTAGRDAPTLGDEVLYAVMSASVRCINNDIPVDLLEQLVLAGLWHPARAVAHARRLTHPERRCQALARLALHLSPERGGEVLARALEAAITIAGEYSRAWALTDLAPVLSTTQMAQALDAAISIREEYSRARALTGLAPHLPAELLAQAVAAATAIVGEYSRAQAMTNLVPHLPADLRTGLLLRTVRIATAISGEYSRAQAMTNLIPHLVADLRTDVRNRALHAANAITDESWRAQALTNLVPHLPPDLRTDVLVQALRAATGIAGEYSRAQAITNLAPCLPADLLVAALALATAITGDYSRARALTGLAPHLPAEQLAHALDAATAIGSEHSRAWALTGLAPHVPGGQRKRVLVHALDAATAITDEGSRAHALTDLAAHLPAALLARALACATAITRGHARAKALTGLAAHLPAEQRAEVLAQAWRAATAFADGQYRARATALHPPAPQTPGYVSVEATVSRLRAGLDRRSRAEVLQVVAGMAAGIRAIGGADAAESALDAVQRSWRWWS